ncbi:hypothetical protein RB195_023897 [Necator americanus]|uniref:Endonuclease/exonuclease/phosphatase domain-containing protein n=1 Tax=Necator americanus TaxID=51031 RepID=A0ABR1ENA1_NECAM
MWSEASFDYLCRLRFNASKDYKGEEVEAFYMDLEKFHREDHIFYMVIIGDFNAKERSEGRLENFTSEPTAFNGMSRERGFSSSSRPKTLHGNSQYQKPSSLR